MTNREQPAWNPHASIPWKVEWHRAGARDILSHHDHHHDHYHGYMVDMARDFLKQDEPEQRRRLWPHGEP